MKFIQYTSIILLLTSMVSCINKEEKKEEEQSSEISTKTTSITAAGEVTKIELTANDILQFSTKEIRVSANKQIILTLRHIGKMDLEVMGHNFVLLKQGTDISRFSTEAANAGKEKDWIPNNGKNILAYTKMIGGGKSASVTFQAPPIGTYDFICSFPGHTGVMRGRFIVE